MKIALMGFDCNSSNKGCEALAYSFMSLFTEIFGSDVEVHNYSYGVFGDLIKHYPEVKFVIRRPKIKDIRDWFKIKKEFDQYDFIFDVTFGDGFSDIYGKMWNVTTNILKTIAVVSKTPFILLPQTYGPYKNKLLRKWAEYIVNNCDVAFSRDIESADYMNEHCNNKVKTLTDMAFALPFDKDAYKFDGDCKKIGINVSSLLWDSVYAEKNKFGLQVKYREYIVTLIQKILNNPNYEVHLIPHVVSKRDYNIPENDVRSCDNVKEKFPTERVIVAPAFDDPMEAKSYISNMDVFIGARMHATIGALSAGIATVPFAYSKKFKTMFGNLSYDYVLDAREISTEEAINQTIEHIENSQALMQKAVNASNVSKMQLGVLREELVKLVKK